MAEKTTVAFRVDESVKKEWEEAAGRPEYDSLSHLIRLAVQREIAETETAHQAPTDTQSDEDGEVLQSLARIERTVTDVKDEVEAQRRENQAENLFELEQVLLETLPSVPEEIEEEILSGPDSGQVEAATETARDMAGRIGGDTSDVAEALDQLVENTAQVQSATSQETEETYYWRVE